MRKWYGVNIDNKTNKIICYSECSLNEVGFELETQGIEVKDVKYIPYSKDDSCVMVTNIGNLYYDGDRRMLLKDEYN